MADNEEASPRTPKALKPAKTGVAKRTPAKKSAASPAKARDGVDKDVYFLWKCIKSTPGTKFDWVALSKDLGSPVVNLQKRYSRLNIRMEKFAATQTEGSEKDTGFKTDQGAGTNESE